MTEEPSGTPRRLVNWDNWSSMMGRMDSELVGRKVCTSSVELVATARRTASGLFPVCPLVLLTPFTRPFLRLLFRICDNYSKGSCYNGPLTNSIECINCYPIITYIIEQFYTPILTKISLIVSQISGRV